MIVRQCCECLRIFNPDTKEWSMYPQEFNNNATHGFCPDCFKKAMDKFHALKKEGNESVTKCDKLKLQKEAKIEHKKTI